MNDKVLLSLISSFNLCLEMTCFSLYLHKSKPFIQEGCTILSSRTTKGIIVSDLHILENDALGCELPKFNEFHVDWDLGMR